MSATYFIDTYKQYPVTICGQRVILTNGELAALSIGAGTHYFQYIVGDLKLFSVVSAVSVISFPLIPFFLKIVRKIGKKNFLAVGFGLGAAGVLFRLIGYDNVPLLAVGNL